MERRSFLKTIAGAIAGAIVGVKLKPLPVEAPALSRAPRGLAFLVNQDSGVFQSLSRVTYPELKSPVIDLHGGPLTREVFDKAVAIIRSKYQAEAE